MKNGRFFPEIRGNFGFGCMRLPMKDGEVELSKFCEMVDAFIDAGFNYFDTAHGYLKGKSETAVRDGVSARYKRDRFLLTNKLTEPYFEKQEDIRPLLESQLELCGVDYFDFYLMHAQDKNNYEKFTRCRAYETAFKLKEEGLIRHVGLSFHDKAEVLERILGEHPEVEIVQIQLNYLDWEDESVDSRRVYEVCEKFKKPVVVMEPVKGGSLAKLPDEADAVLRALSGGSNASYAIRYAAGFENVEMVLSGVSDMDQMRDNIGFMREFEPLNGSEKEALKRVREVIRGMDLIPCTGCKYCIEENQCPMDILIPELFASLNAHEAFHNWNTGYYYQNVLTSGHGKASDCVECGMCEGVCPQHLEIRRLLKDVAAAFEKKE